MVSCMEFYKIECTGGPRYMRSFYLRIRVYAIGKNTPKFFICDVLLHLPRIYAIFNEKCLIFNFKMSYFLGKNKILIKISS